jgi:hypothetical protein
MQITVTATIDEKLELVKKALTTGLPTLADSGIELNYAIKDYEKAFATLSNGSGPADFVTGTICVEDVQTQILAEGGKLQFIDHESDGEYTRTLTVVSIEQNWHKVPAKIALELHDGDWDANTADTFMQYLLYGEVIFG